MPTLNAHSPSGQLPARHRALHALLIAGGLSVLLACGKTELKEAPVRAVKVLTIAADQNGQSAESYAGEVRARLESKLSFRVGGKLLARPAQ